MSATLPAANDCCTPCGTDSVVIGTSFGWFVVSTIAALRSIDDSTLNKFAVVGTTGGYSWNPTSGAVDDGVNVIKPTNSKSAGRWIKVSI